MQDRHHRERNRKFADSPLDIPEDGFDLSAHRQRTFYQAHRGKDDKSRIVALEPEICRSIIRYVFLHSDED